MHQIKRVGNAYARVANNEHEDGKCNYHGRNWGVACPWVVDFSNIEGTSRVIAVKGGDPIFGECVLTEISAEGSAISIDGAGNELPMSCCEFARCNCGYGAVKSTMPASIADTNFEGCVGSILGGMWDRKIGDDLA